VSATPGASAGRLILASASPRRRELLERVGFALDVRPADIDEAERPGEDPAAYVARIARGKADARKLAHARVLLQADEADGGPGWVDETIAAAVRVSVRTIERVRQRFVEQGLAAALLPKPSPRIYGRKLDARPGLRPAARGQGALVAAPAGRAHGRAGARGHALARDGAPDAQKN